MSKQEEPWWKRPDWWTAIAACVGTFLLIVPQAAAIGDWLANVFTGEILVRLIGLACIVVPFFLWIRSNAKRMDKFEGDFGSLKTDNAEQIRSDAERMDKLEDDLGKLETDKVDWNATTLSSLQSRVANLEKKGVKRPRKKDN